MGLQLLEDTITSVCDNIIKTRGISKKFNPNGLGDQLYKLMLNNSRKIAQINGITGETQTYEDFLSRCIKAAEAMRRFGIKPGDVITPCTDNHMDTCVPFIASLFIGAYNAPIDKALPEDEMKRLLNQFQPKIIFCSSDAEKIIETKLDTFRISSTIIVFGERTTHLNFEDFLRSVSNTDKFEVYKAKNLTDTAFLTLTGGSCGNHKAACLHHLNMFNFVNSCSYASEKNSVVLSFSPILWINGPLNVCRAILNGCARLILPKFDPKVFFYLIDKYKITGVTLSTFNIIQLLQEKVPKDANISSLKWVRYVGGPLSKSSIQELMKMLPTRIISSLYGQSEVGGLLLNYDWSEHPEYWKDKLGSVGRPMEGISYKLIDIDTGETLGPNKPGHLLVKTNLQMNGYYKCDSSNVCDEDGWLKTGDILYYDEQYFFYFVDRIKEMIRYRSWATSPNYLEGILMSHPSIELAFVTGVPHDQDGDHPIGVVVLKEGKYASATELEEFVNDQVEEPRKLRRGVKIIKRNLVPLSVVGKIKRYEFRRRVLGML